MQDIVKRYFWVVGALAVMVSAYFAATTVGSIVEAKVLPAAKDAPKIPVVQQEIKPTTTARSKVGQPIADRDMFCSDCKPAAAPASVTDNATPGGVVATQLHLLLIATSISSNEKESFATILNTDTSSQGGYFEDDEIPGAGPVKAIHYKYVDFDNTQTHRTERIGLLGEPPPAAAPVVASNTPTAPPDPDDELAQSVANGVKKIDDNNFEISRGLVDKVLANPMAIAKGARVVPSVKDGKANGFKLYAIRPGSVYAQIGLANGDTIHAINGFDLTSPDKALEVYTKVKEATSLTVAVTRRGKEQVINYTIK